MKNFWINSDWLRVALLLSEISHYWLVCFVGQSSLDEEDEGQEEKTEAVEYFKKYSSWMERKNHVDTIQIIQLWRMKELSMHKR